MRFEMKKEDALVGHVCVLIRVRRFPSRKYVPTCPYFFHYSLIYVFFYAIPEIDGVLYLSYHGWIWGGMEVFGLRKYSKERIILMHVYIFFFLILLLSFFSPFSPVSDIRNNWRQLISDANMSDRSEASPMSSECSEENATKEWERSKRTWV